MIIDFCFIKVSSSLSGVVLLILASFSAIAGSSFLVGILAIFPFSSFFISSGNLPLFARIFLNPLSRIEEPKIVYKTTSGTLVQTS